MSNVETHMWSGTAGENNPCPWGFRIPTAAEWEQERLTWSTKDAAGAFTSPLKLPLAGDRISSNGELYLVGFLGGYWSSTISGSSSWVLDFNSGSANIDPFNRAFGFPVRCIKD